MYCKPGYHRYVSGKRGEHDKQARGSTVDGQGRRRTRWRSHRQTDRHTGDVGECRGLTDDEAGAAVVWPSPGGRTRPAEKGCFDADQS